VGDAAAHDADADGVVRRCCQQLAHHAAQPAAGAGGVGWSGAGAGAGAPARPRAAGRRRCCVWAGLMDPAAASEPAPGPVAGLGGHALPLGAQHRRCSRPPELAAPPGAGALEDQPPPQLLRAQVEPPLEHGAQHVGQRPAVDMDPGHAACTAEEEAVSQNGGRGGM
jgi:hypothetical protein